MTGPRRRGGWGEVRPSRPPGRPRRPRRSCRPCALWERARLRDLGHGADGGSGTVTAVAVVAALLTTLAMSLVVAGAICAAHVARGAADLAALAGAQEAVAGSSPEAACTEARRVAGLNGAALVSCEAGPGGVVTVATEHAVRHQLPGLPAAMAGRARAGPAPADEADAAGLPDPADGADRGEP